MFGDQITKLTVQRSAAQEFVSLREAMAAVENTYQWLSAQLDADLTTLGFTATDITFLRSAYADLHDLYLRYTGQAAAIAQPYDYRVNAKQIIGP